MNNANNYHRAATKLEIGAQIRSLKGMQRSTLEITFRSELKTLITNQVAGCRTSWKTDARITAMSMILDGRATKLGLI